MKRNYLAILIILTLGFGCSEETIKKGQSETFIKFFGNSQVDEGTDVKQLTDGGYIIIGTSTTGSGDKDIALIRTDKYGNEEWSVYFGDTGDDVGKSIQVTQDGGFIMVGSWFDIQAGTSDLYLIKTDQQGSVQWEKKITKPGNQVGNSVLELTDGYVMTGTSDQYGNEDIIVVRTTTTGDILEDDDSWYATRGYGITDAGNQIIKVPAENEFIVIGTTSLEDPGQGLLNSNIITIHITGNGVGWSNVIFGGSGDDLGASLQHISDNQYIMAGTLDDGVNSKMFIQQIQLNNEDISKTWGSPATYIEYSGKSSGKSVQVTPDGGFAILGSVLTSPGNSDFYLVLTNATGAVQAGKTMTFGGTGNEYGVSLQQTADGGFIMVGSTGIPEDENREIALIKTNSMGQLY